MGRDGEAARAKAGEETVDRKLLQRYLSGAAEKVTGLEAAVAAARAGQTGARDSLRRALHKLAGSAGTYGFDELGGEARDLAKRVQAADEPRALEVSRAHVIGVEADQLGRRRLLRGSAATGGGERDGTRRECDHEPHVRMIADPRQRVTRSAKPASRSRGS